MDPSTYIGNGSYKVTEWVHNSNIKMVPSETYYDFANLGPDVINFALMDDANAMLAAYRNGTLDFFETVPNDEIPAMLASGELNIVDYIGTYYATFNNTKAPFDDVRVRKAFSLAIDRNYIVNQVTKTGEQPANGYVPAGIDDAAGPSGDDFRTVGKGYYSIADSDYKANCDEARALLAEAGYPEGKGLPIIEYMYNTLASHQAIAEALQNMWQTELGVTVQLSNQEWAVFLETRKNGDYMVARNGWIADYNYPMSFLDMWITGGGNNDAQYSNKEYDALIDRVIKSSDKDEKFALMHKAEDILMKDDVFSAPIYFYVQKYVKSDKFEGMYYTPLGWFFFNYATPSGSN
jgi:oligopeptide transport system substrate-binding protein